MKTINTYILSKIKNETNITEKLKISKNPYSLFPKSRDELINMIKEETKKNGNNCDLNHIDVSNIESMAFLFSNSNRNFNGDISDWDVSNVKIMSGMFWKSDFNGDLSKWDVSNVKNMHGMFANSEFNNDSICYWDVSNVTNMRQMFEYSIFNQDISDWNVSNNSDASYMFNSCPIKDKYKPKRLK